MKPPAGEYGPIPWSVPRPFSLWAAASLLVGAVVFDDLLTGGTLFVIGWLFSFGIVSILLKGSRLFWWLAIVWAALGLFGSVTDYGAAEGAGAFGAVLEMTSYSLAIVLLWVPATRRFFDLEWRKENLVTPEHVSTN